MLEAVALNAMSVGVTSWHGNDRGLTQLGLVVQM